MDFAHYDPGCQVDSQVTFLKISAFYILSRLNPNTPCLQPSYNNLHSRKCIWKCLKNFTYTVSGSVLSANWFCLNVLKYYFYKFGKPTYLMMVVSKVAVTVRLFDWRWVLLSRSGGRISHLHEKTQFRLHVMEIIFIRYSEICSKG